jgi:hypothetical protein
MKTTTALMTTTILALAAGTVNAAAFPETESNNTKATANLIGPMTAGDTITGTTNNATTDPDYFRVRTSNIAGAGLPKITRNTMTSSALTGMNVRGVNRGFVAGDVDVTGSIRNSLVWYTIGDSSDLSIRGSRTSGSGTFNFTFTLAQAAITPTSAGSIAAISGFAGITLESGQTTPANTDIVIYDETFALIGANDNGAVNDNRAKWTGSLPVGRYYVGIANVVTQIAHNTSYNSTPGNAFFSAGGIGNSPQQLDANNVGSLYRNDALTRSATEQSLKINGTTVLATNGTGSGEIAFYAFDVVPTPSAMAMLGLGGLVASRRRRA